MRIVAGLFAMTLDAENGTLLSWWGRSFGGSRKLNGRSGETDK